MAVNKAFPFLELVYGGRVLKKGRSVEDYKVVAGCTIYMIMVPSHIEGIVECMDNVVNHTGIEDRGP